MWFLTKVLIFDENFDFWRKFWFLTKVLIFDKNCDFWRTFLFLTIFFDFWPNFLIFDKTILLLTKKSIAHQNFYFWLKISIFDENFDFWPKFRLWRKIRFLAKLQIYTTFLKQNYCAKIWIFGQNILAPFFSNHLLVINT